MEIPFVVLQKCGTLRRGHSSQFEATVEVNLPEGSPATDRTNERVSKRRIPCILTVKRSAADKISFHLNEKKPQNDTQQDCDEIMDVAIFSTIELVQDETHASEEEKVEELSGHASAESFDGSVNDGSTIFEKETRQPAADTGHNTRPPPRKRKLDTSPVALEFSTKKICQQTEHCTPGTEPTATNPRTSGSASAIEDGTQVRRSSRTPKKKSFEGFVEHGKALSVSASVVQEKQVLRAEACQDVKSKDASAASTATSASKEEDQGESHKTPDQECSVVESTTHIPNEDVEMPPSEGDPGSSAKKKSTAGSFPCPKCNKIFRHRTNLIEHNRCVHQASEPLVCPFCEKLMKHRDGLKAHYRKFHKGETLDSSQIEGVKQEILDALGLVLSKIQCKICSVIFGSKKELLDHMQEHSSDPEFQECATDLQSKAPHICPVCGREFGTSAGLRNHEQRAHGQDLKAVECPYCKKVQVHQYACRDHIRRIHKDVSLKEVKMEDFQPVDEDSVVSLTGPVIVQLQKRQDGDSPVDSPETNSSGGNQLKPVACPVCGYVQLTREALKEHIRAEHKDIVADDLDEENFSEIEVYNVVDGQLQEVVLDQEGISNQEVEKKMEGETTEIVLEQGAEPTPEESNEQMTLDETALTLASLSGSFVQEHQGVTLIQTGDGEVVQDAIVVQPKEEAGDNDNVVTYLATQNEDDASLSSKKRGKCPLCSKICNSMSSLVNHVGNVHPNDPLVGVIKQQLWPHLKTVCQLCGTVISNYSNLQRHMAAVHERGEPEACRYCNRIYNSKMKLDLHVKRVHSGTMLMCGICNKLFKHKAGLTDHIKFMHNADNRVCRFECEVCHKRFMKKGYLSTHMKTHLPEKRFECDICHNKFSRRENLESHQQRIHFGTAKTYGCTQCSSTFTSLWYLKTHIANTHTDEPRFTCTVCSRAFMSNCSLAEHVKSVHLMRKDFKCSRCGSEFSRRRALVYHRRKVHMEENADDLVANDERNNLITTETDSAIIAAASVEGKTLFSGVGDSNAVEVKSESQNVLRVVGDDEEKVESEELVYEISGLEEGEYVITYSESGDVILMSSDSKDIPTTVSSE